MKKILIMLLLICMVGCLNRSFVYAESDKYVKALYSSVNIFKDTDINTDADNDGEALDIISKIKYGQKLKVVLDSFVGDDGFNYYGVSFSLDGEEEQGYVLSSQVLLSSISSPQKDLDHNAIISKNTKLYGYEELRFVELGKELAAGEQIKILNGYNKSSDYTRIQYKDESGDILTAYIKTADIQTSGVSRATIGAIIIIITIVSLVLVVFGIKGSKKKKKSK